MDIHPSANMYKYFMVITIVLAHAPTSVIANDDQGYLTCSTTFHCANIQNIGYPFWGLNRSENCGYRGFELDCGENLPKITIANKTHYILNISKDTQTLSVAREDYWFNICPSNLSNYTLDINLFNYTSNTQNMTLFYNCPTVSSDISPFLSPWQFYCPPPYENTINLYYTRDPNSTVAPAVIDYLEGCAEKIVIPVLQTALYNTLLRNLSEAINGGFELEWYANNSICDECEASNGVCGYNRSTTEFTCYCPDHPYSFTCPAGSFKKPDMQKNMALGISAGLGGIILLSVLVICIQRRKHLSFLSLVLWMNQNSNDQDVEEFIRKYGSLAPKHYKYSDVKKMTNSFSEKIGQGGHGAVYKGKLSDGRAVAVKIPSQMKENGQDGEEFMNEVACITSTSHVNIVSLLGFCYERHKRALIYEYMPNGSLDKFIYKQASSDSNHHLEWRSLYQIVVGVAQGLEYLHRGCSTRIVHFDIKPHNILLDEHFCPKISDFGLAKQYKNKESIMSMLYARGTIGYIAPEVIWRHFGGVSYKSDVYGYGMMVLEMVGIRKNIAHGVSTNSEILFPDWIYELIEIKDDLTLHGVVSKEDEVLVKKMILVSLWCIQINPLDRPSMSKVVDMLEGGLESLLIPPKPILYSSEQLEDAPTALESLS